MPSNLADMAYSRLLDPFYRINPTQEEYVLLKMLLYCYYPSTSSLSSDAKQKLQAEYEKVSKLLLLHLQIQYGKDEGAKKFSECVALIGTLFHFFERHKEIYIFTNMSQKKKAVPDYDKPNWKGLMDEIFS